MSKDTILTDGDGWGWSMDRLKQSSYLAGRIGGLEVCVAFIHERAVELFKSGAHGQAIALQGLAHEMSFDLEKKMRGELDAYDHVFPSKLPSEPAAEPEEPPVALLKLPDPEPADEPVLEPASCPEDDDIPF